MKSEMAKKANAKKLKSDEIKLSDETSDWTIVRLNEKIKAGQVRYGELLLRVQKFISETQKLIEPAIQTLSSSAQENFRSEINYFLTPQDSLYTQQLFCNFKQDLIEKLSSKDFDKEKFKTHLLDSIKDLSLGVTPKEPMLERRRSQQSIQSCEYYSSNFVKDLTPLRNSRRSTSPCDKAPGKYIKENAELKISLAEVTKQRDFLKAWKENLVKNPNFDSSAQRVIKELKDDMELVMVKNNCLQSKLVCIVSSVSKFLNISSKFQRPIREKEGFLSMNLYENEKHRLESTMREILNKNEAVPKSASLSASSPMRIVENEAKPVSRNEENLRPELRKRSREVLSSNTEKINVKIIEELNRQHNEKTEALSQTINRLENDNHALRSKYFLLKKESKALQANSNLAHSHLLQSEEKKNREFLIMLKIFLEKKLKSFFSAIETKYKEILFKANALGQKNLDIEAKIKQVLQSNLTSLIAMNEKAECADQNTLDIHKLQLANLEYMIEQSKNYSDNRIRELEETIFEYESNKEFMSKAKLMLENEVASLLRENHRVRAIEESHGAEIERLKITCESQINTIKGLQKYEALAQQLKFERDLLEQENKEINESIIVSSNALVEAEQSLQFQAIAANKRIEQLFFEKSEQSVKLQLIEGELEKFKKISADFECLLGAERESHKLVEGLCNEFKARIEQFELKSTDCSPRDIEFQLKEDLKNAEILKLKELLEIEIAKSQAIELIKQSEKNTECECAGFRKILENLSVRAGHSIQNPNELEEYIFKLTDSFQKSLESSEQAKIQLDSRLQALESQHKSAVSLFTQDFSLLKKHLLHAQNEKEVESLHLARLRKTHKSFESILKPPSLPSLPTLPTLSLLDSKENSI